MYRSIAKWPRDQLNLGTKGNLTNGYHETRSEAKTACKALKSHGFCGCGEVFPTRVWINKLEEV